MVFPARYASRCVSCEERIHEGDPIRMSDDGPAHEDCSTAPAQPSRPEPAPCRRCWLVHGGECDR